MKIKRLRLAAYGPFSDVILDMPGRGPDFYMVYGPNEAGKSTALRALRYMLFGIPARTPDKFLHSYAKLRIGARLVNSDGGEIEFLRRKGQHKTLRSKDDETVLADDALVPFLGGVSPAVFEQMFAIGHEDLIRGGEEIISGKGSIGEALFAAGAGLISLQNIQNDLDRACGELFKPTGSTPSINRMIKSIKVARQLQKDALLPPKTWKNHDKGLRDAQKRLDEVKNTLATHQHRQAKLGRINEALPLIARKKEIDDALFVYQQVPDLADDFGDKRRDVEKDMKLATRDLERSRTSIKNIIQEIEALPTYATILENAATIESLQHELGSYRKAQRDRPELEGRMRTLQKLAAEMLAEIGSDITGDAARELKLSPSTVGEIQELGKEYERLTVKKESAVERQRKLKSRFARLSDQRRAIPEPADVSQLEYALQSAIEAGQIEKQIAEIRTSRDALEGASRRLLNRQILWKGSLARIDGLPLPSRENVERFESRFETLQRVIEKQRETKASTENEVALTQAAVQAIDFSQEVPTETDLKHARDLRNKGWGLIRQHLEGQVPPTRATEKLLRHFEGVNDLPDAFENSMFQADHISDRLRRESGQVSKRVLLEAQKEQLVKTLGEIAAALETSLSKQRDLESEWQSIWEPAGIAPQTPREMRSWLSEIDLLRDKLVESRSLNKQLEVLSAHLASLKSGLLTAIETDIAQMEQAVSLGSLVKTAQVYLHTQRDLESSVASADRELNSLKTELEENTAVIAELEKTLERWKTSWETSVRKLGIRADATPTAAIAVIESVRDVRNKINDADNLQHRIHGIDRDSSEFKTLVENLVGTLAPDLKPESIDRAAELLNGKLTHARKRDARRLSLEERLEAAKQEREAAERGLFECKALMASLCEEAGCQHPESLAGIEKKAIERKVLTRELDALEHQLRTLSAGAAVSEFIDEAYSVDADAIVPELDALEVDMQRLEIERSELDQQIGALNVKLAQMDGVSAAAIHAESAERLLASLDTKVEKYAQLKIASIILARTVEQYREKHQGPLVSRASELFTRMTLGAFSRLRADYDEKGHPILVGIRSNTGLPVHVEGMSDGTADQLYLALRLASLEQYLAHNEALPFVVDDILLRFDDQRALATLEVLASLADKTQVIFFTHHQHMVDIAAKNIDSNKFFVLDLERSHNVRG